jgi:hypothetical protein
VVVYDGAFASSAVVGNQIWVLDGAPGSSAIAGNFASGTSVIGTSNITYRIDYNAAGDPLGTGNDVLLTVTSVPEPASLALLALGAIGLLARRRHRVRGGFGSVPPAPYTSTAIQATSLLQQFPIAHTD